MCSIFLDTNILIDYTVHKREHHADAQRLIEAATSAGAQIYVLISSFKDLYYVCHRAYCSEADARKMVRIARTIGSVVELTCAISDRALFSDEPDFEDGLIRAAAELVRADVLVTRDAGAFQSSELKTCTAAEALGLFA